MSDEASIRVSKISGAHRQLKTAITLWGRDDDPVAVHTLAVAAYEVFHFVSKKRDPNRRDLLFDTDWIKDEYRRDWVALIKKSANFFKHADRDPDAILDFDPGMNEWYILYATAARQLCGEAQSQEESDFMWWFTLNRPQFLTDEGRKMLADRWPSDVIEYGRGLTKKQFFEAVRNARYQLASKAAQDR
jgi:hypothetical protein